MQYDIYGRSILRWEEAEMMKIKDRRTVQELIMYTKSEWAKMKIERDWWVWHKSHTIYKGELYGKVGSHQQLPIVGKTIEYARPSHITLRSYQQDVVTYVKNMKGKALLIEAMTGAGKTWIIYGIIKELWRRVLISCKNKRLQKQIYDDFVQLHHSIGMVNGWKNMKSYDITITTNTTFAKYHEDFQWQYDVLIIDETHNIPESMRDAINLSQAKRVFGLTATPERTERWVEAMKEFFGDYYKCNEKEIKETWVVLPVCVYTVKHTTYCTIEDYKEARKTKEWWQYSDTSHHIYRNILTMDISRYEKLWKVIQLFQTKWMDSYIVFCDREDHAQETYEYLKKTLDCPVFCITGATKKQDDIINAYKEQWWVLVGNVKCLGDWFNVPRIQVWIQYYATKTERVLIQNIGRMRRAYWDKKWAFFVDFQDNVWLITWWKKKYLWWNVRNSIYKKLWYETRNLVI